MAAREVPVVAPRWAMTYGCSEEAVKSAWEKAQWLATQKPVEESFK